MAALQYVDEPGYSALLLRRTYPELSQSGGLMFRSHEWLADTDARWNAAQTRWEFPSGAILQFGYLEHDAQKHRYASSEYQFIGFDELTQFTEGQYTFLFSRLRRKLGVNIPIRMRSASNPGAVGHVWVKERFRPDQPGLCPAGRIFVPARLRDNPFIDASAYERTLQHLTPVDRARLLDGDWTATEGGKVFSRSWFRTVLQAPPTRTSIIQSVRGWDLAATSVRPGEIDDKGKRTAGVRMSKTMDGLYVVEHALAGKWHPGDRDVVIRQVAEADGIHVAGLIEEEPGSGGIAQNHAIIKSIARRRYESIRVSGPKEVRAGPLASQAQIGNVALVAGPWINEYLDELELFPDGQYVDLVDASSLAFNYLAPLRRPAPTGGTVEQRCICGGETTHSSWCPNDKPRPEHHSPLSDLRGSTSPLADL